MGKKTEEDVLQRGFRESAIGGRGELGWGRWAGSDSGRKLMSLFPGEVGPYIYPWGQRSQTGSLGVPGVCMCAECVRGGRGYLDTEGERISISQQKEGRWKGAVEKVSVVGQGMCKGLKVETGWGGESTLGGARVHTHTHTHNLTGNISTSRVLRVCCKCCID